MHEYAGEHGFLGQHNSLEEFCVYIILNDSVNPFLKKIYTFVITILLFIYMLVITASAELPCLYLSLQQALY